MAANAPITLISLFEAQVRRAPEAIAAADEARALTYRQLDSSSNGLAARLQKEGVGPEILVGVAVDRSVEMLVALLGILKAGGAYLPLDADYPAERLAFMAEDSRLGFVLTQGKILEGMPKLPGKMLCIESLSGEGAEAVKGGARPESPAYAIYTSGSTGRPKAALIEHRSLVNLLEALRERPGITAADVMLASTTLSFDMAAVELFLPLAAGGRVFVAGRSLFRDPAGFLGLVEKSGSTIMQGTPSFFHLLIEAGWKGRPGQKIFCGGEALREPLAADLLKRSASVWNLYGPTEATVYATGFQVTEAASPICIGTPLAGTQAHILDEQLRPIAEGELYLGGAGLARGYLNRPELTKEKFILDPSRGRLYKTGDLARLLPDGNLEFLGRADDQVKLRGFRIEPGEIESALAEHPGVGAALAAAREERLVAYVVPREGRSPSASELRDFLKAKLPEHLIPSKFEFLSALPVTPGGKADRRALPAPGTAREAGEAAAPRTEPEATLAKIFAEVLKLDRVGLSESFFDLGGTSLLTLELIARIEKVLDRKVSHAALFHAPSVQELAGVLAGRAVAPAVSGVLPHQPSGPRPPYFGVGSGPDARCLARRLGSDQPFVGVILEETDLQALPAPFRVEDIAAVLIGKIRAIRPRGPYVIGNGCAPVFIAYEVAQQLRAQGEQVPLLALMSFANPGHIPRYIKEQEEEGLAAGASFLRRRLKFVLGHFLEFKGTRARAAYVLGKLGERLERASWRTEVFFFRLRLGLGLPVGRNMRHVNLILESALRGYKPRHYEGRAALIRSETLPGDPYIDDDDLGWGELVKGNLDVHFVFCAWGRDMFMEPEVQTVAEKLKAALEGARPTAANIVFPGTRR